MAATTYRVTTSLYANLNTNATHYLSIMGAGIAWATRNAVFLTRAAYTIGNLFVYVVSNGISAASSVKFSVNTGAGGNPQVSLTANTTGIFEDTSNTASLSAGDTCDWVVSVGKTSHTDSGIFNISVIGCTMAHGSDSISLLGSEKYGSSAYYGIFGKAEGTTETPISYKFETSTTLSSLRFYLAGNSGGATTPIIRISGANGTQTLSIGASTSGSFEDLTHTDNVSAGSVVDVSIGTTPGYIPRPLTFLSNSNARQSVLGSTTSGYVHGNLTIYHGIEGHPSSGEHLTEARAQTTMRVAHTARRMGVYCDTYANPATVTLRKDGADTALAVSIVGTGWTENLSDSVSVAATENLNYKIVGPSSGQNYVTFIGMEYPGPAAAGPAALKTIEGLATSAVKTVQGLAIGSVKTYEGLA